MQKPLPHPFRFVLTGGLVVFFLILIGAWGFILYQNGKRLCQAILSPSISTEQTIKSLQWWWKPASVIVQKLPPSSISFLSDSINSLRAVDDVITHLQLLLGDHTPRHYAVLFQNNMELRPTGGFLGSYAEIWMDKGKLTNLQIQDIYVPDGQIKGYVKEPEPIKKYLFNEEHPGWRLRDSNWSPDFPEAVKAINWFFKEGEIATMDGMIAINLHPITDILQVTGPIVLPDYGNLEVTASTFYQEAQRHAEENFFPGSTQKGSFLGSVGKQLLLTITSRSDIIPKMFPVIASNLRQKHISLFIPDALKNGWQELGWDGSLRSFSSDFLMINEANLGASKANCCIDRSLTDSIVVSKQDITHNLTLTYVNHNPTTPKPPQHWGGGYKDYIRIVVPQDASLSGISVNGNLLSPENIDQELIGKHRTFGFLVLTEGGQTSTLTATYQVPRIHQIPYSLMFQKQSGVDFWPISLSISNNNNKRIYQEQRLQLDRIFY